VSYALYWGVANYLVLSHQVHIAEDAGYSSMFSVSIFALFGVSLFLGQSWGGFFTPTIYAGSADIFSGRYFGAISGLLLTGMGIGAVFGPWLGGAIYDAAGTYRPSLILCILCIALS
jgi:MFS family permease